MPAERTGPGLVSMTRAIGSGTSKPPRLAGIPRSPAERRRRIGTCPHRRHQGAEATSRRPSVALAAPERKTQQELSPCGGWRFLRHLRGSAGIPFLCVHIPSTPQTSREAIFS